MKKYFYLFAMVLALTAFTSLNAKADTDSGGILGALGLGGSSTPSNPSSSNCNQPGNTTTLPIDRGILFLTIAGLSIGFLAIKAKFDAAPTKG